MSIFENPTAQITNAPRRAANAAAAKVSDLGRVRDPVAGREPMMCVCMTASVAGVISIPLYPMRPGFARAGITGEIPAPRF
jgi:hypothetical protein